MYQEQEIIQSGGYRGEFINAGTGWCLFWIFSDRMRIFMVHIHLCREE